MVYAVEWAVINLLMVAYPDDAGVVAVKNGSGIRSNIMNVVQQENAGKVENDDSRPSQKK